MPGVDEPLTPAESERAVKAATNKVSKRTLEFIRSGDALVDATREHRIALTRAEFDPASPRVVRGETTVGDREAWIRRACAAEMDVLHAAEVMRDNAMEALRSARKELDGAMAVNASVREAYKNGVVV